MAAWHHKRVLVTGAGGFLGSHLTASLVRAGARVRAVVRYNSRNDWGLLELAPPEVRAALEVRPGDLTDPFFTRQVVEGCEVIFHLAALVAIPYSYISPQHFLAVNVGGTLNLLEAAHHSGVALFVHTSTSEVYGSAQYLPMDERHPLRAHSPYAASKIAADQLVESYSLTHGLPAAILRPFNTYGPGQSARAVVPAIISQALAGDTIRLGLLTPRRDFTYVSDIVAAFLRVAEEPKAIGQVIHVGSGTALSIAELAEKIIRLLGGGKKVVLEEERLRPAAGEVMELLCDHRKARELLGWEPRVSLEEGLAETITFIRQHLQRYKPEVYWR